MKLQCRPLATTGLGMLRTKCAENARIAIPECACMQCMYVYIYTHIQLYMHMYTCIYLYIHTYIHSYIYIYICSYLSIREREREREKERERESEREREREREREIAAQPLQAPLTCLQGLGRKKASERYGGCTACIACRSLARSLTHLTHSAPLRSAPLHSIPLIHSLTHSLTHSPSLTFRLFLSASSFSFSCL